MHLPRTSFVAAIVLALAACSPSAGDGGAGNDNPRAPTQAQIDAILAEGPDATLRKMATFDYLVHYRVMEATGMVDALGGEAKAVAALKALGDQNERWLRGAQADAPRMIPAAFDGSGLDSGFAGLAIGAFGGLIAGGMVNGAVQDMSDERLAELAKAGPVKLGGDKDGKGGAELKFGTDGSLDQTLEFEGKATDGLSGKMKIKIHMDACPDPEGKLTVTLNVDSQMSVVGQPGVGGHVRSEFKLERFLDDDAHLIPDHGTNASMTMSAGGTGGGKQQTFDLKMGFDRNAGSGYEDFNDYSGFSIFRMDEVKHAAKLAEQSFIYQQLIAEIMLRGMGKGAGPWESGRCVELKATSSPGKRKGIRPNTAFDLEAIPRAKSDGAPTGGTVTATLSGGASLQPSSGKVPADAKYAYAGPDKKNEEATIKFEARSKRGVGRATLEFDTKRPQAYNAVGGLDDFHGTGTICNLGETFTISGGGNTVTFTPNNEEGGSYSYQGNMRGIGVYGNGTYTVDASEKGGTLTGTGNGCVKTPMGTRCNNGTERYTLVPIPPCEES